MYIDNRAKFEDAKSTGFSFTLVGGIGIILLILIDTDILSLPIQDYMKIILSVVMGILFLLFFLIGIHSFLSLKQIRQDAGKQEDTEKEITEWFLSHYKDELTSYRTPDMDDTSPDTFYYPRYEKMNTIISAQYPDLNEDEKDHLIESLYETIFH